MATYQVGYLIGSLSSTSINRKLAQAMIKLAPPDMQFTEIPFRDLPIYSPDFDADYPPVGRAFKEAIKAVDAVWFVTPEYNRSIPGGLKNAIDWATRPWGTNSFARKPSAVIGASPGAIGTALAQQSLRGVQQRGQVHFLIAQNAEAQQRCGPFRFKSCECPLRVEAV